MHPIILKIGPVVIYSYGLMLALGFAIAVYLVRRRAEIEGIKSSVIVDLCFCIIVTGIIGARLLYVFENYDYYLKNPLEIPMINKGGLILYGGIILASVTTIIFVKVRSLHLWKVADLLMPYVAFGQAIGRIGCLLNGCCYGKPTAGLFGVNMPGHYTKIHPTQLFESVAMLFIFFALLLLRKRKKYDGQIFFYYVIFYSIIRFLIEFLRGDNQVVFLALTLSQIISLLLLFSAFIAMPIVASRKVKDR